MTSGPVLQDINAKPPTVPTAVELLAMWGAQLMDPTVMAILKAAVEGDRRGEIHLFFSNKGVPTRPPAIYISPDGTRAAS
jgi:hypothetical protein